MEKLPKFVYSLNFIRMEQKNENRKQENKTPTLFTPSRKNEKKIIRKDKELSTTSMICLVMMLKINTSGLFHENENKNTNNKNNNTNRNIKLLLFLDGWKEEDMMSTSHWDVFN